MIIKCKDNNGVGDCPYRKFCLAAMNDRTISGCNLPLVWSGMVSKDMAVVEHTVKVREVEHE